MKKQDNEKSFVSETGVKPSQAETGVKPSTAQTGVKPSALAEKNEKNVEHTRPETGVAEAGAEPVAVAEAGVDPVAVAKTGVKPVAVAKTGVEASVVAKTGVKPSEAEAGVDPKSVNEAMETGREGDGKGRVKVDREGESWFSKLKKRTVNDDEATSKTDKDLSKNQVPVEKSQPGPLEDLNQKPSFMMNIKPVVAKNDFESDKFMCKSEPIAGVMPALGFDIDDLLDGSDSD